MTDGIIQKVFRPFIEESKYGIIYHEKDVLKLQRELIKEIKKEFPTIVISKNTLSIIGMTNYDIVRQKLIGDNE